MSVRQFLHYLSTRQIESTTVYECRHCGTTVDSQADPCPYCGLLEAVEYELPKEETVSALWGTLFERQNI